MAVLDVAATAAGPGDGRLLAPADQADVLDAHPGRRLETLPVRRHRVAGAVDLDHRLARHRDRRHPPRLEGCLGQGDEPRRLLAPEVLREPAVASAPVSPKSIDLGEDGF